MATVDLPLSDVELRVAARVDSALAGAVELKRWWEQVDATDSYPNKYPEALVFNRPEDGSFGFIGDAPLSTGRLPVNGNVQTMFYDRPKATEPREQQAAQWTKRQLREFVLRYFMRVSDYRQPQQFPENCGQNVGPLLQLFDFCPSNNPEVDGFGFEQLFYKSRQTGDVVGFRPEERNAIVDLREMGERYEWIVLKNPIFNFDINVRPLGNNGPRFVFPLSEFNYLAVSLDFVVDQDRPEPGVLGRYGVGYAFIQNPEPSLFAYGPGELEPAFEQLNWEIREDGSIIARFTFVANQPTKLINISVDPLRWGWEIADALTRGVSSETLSSLRALLRSYPAPSLPFSPAFSSVALLNLVTFGQASQQLCISREQILKGLLFVHFVQHYQTALGSLQTWRQVSNWLDEKELPDFVRTGVST